MKDAIKNYIRAGYAGLYLLSAEEQRVEADVKAVAAELDCRLHAWSPVQGLADLGAGTMNDCPDPIDVLERIEELPEKSLVLLRDFHLFLEDGNPVLIRKLKEVLAHCRAGGKTIAFCGCRQNLPPELEREVTTVEFALPGKDALARVLEGIATSAGLAAPGGDEKERLLDAAGGLTTIEAENAFALSVAETGTITADVVAREKAAVLKKGGLLEVTPVTETLAQIGGLDVLKTWLIQRQQAFGGAARDYGLPRPKGVLITGIPGTGKSLTAKATASAFGLPLLRMDMGRIFAGLVGQSESNLRTAIATAEAMAPCVLMIDELEKGTSGAARSSGSTDGGTGSRVLGSFLSWMQDKTAPVFVVATANDVTQLPPELLRKGRFDELFFVDLPGQNEREAIWAIQIRKYGRKPEAYDLRALAQASDRMTGSEIEQAFVEALYAGFANAKEPDDATVHAVLQNAVPLAATMAEKVEALRKWAHGRARLATSAGGDGTIRNGRKLAAMPGRN